MQKHKDPLQNIVCLLFLVHMLSAAQQHMLVPTLHRRSDCEYMEAVDSHCATCIFASLCHSQREISKALAFLRAPNALSQFG